MSKKLLPLFAFIISTAVHAERADREKPINLEADKITVDDARKVHVFEGNVQFTQGTLVIRADKIVVTQDASGNQTGVATGGPDGLAHFKQKREGRDDLIEGEAERIVNDSKADKSELFGHAKMRSGLDEVSGEYISYDGKTENYVVSNAPGGTVTQGAKAGRVHAIIQPRNKSTAKPAQ
ncbi:MAG: lipopolysaccharide transport periplasmic protein LptA [Georgfuchsia sp.]